MKGKPWKDEISEGRVFELRSKSKRYPAPCALITNTQARYNEKAMVAVDKLGVIGNGLYRRDSNPDIYVDGIRLDKLPRRIVRRRRDLERFDSDDMRIIRYGCAMDFDGKIDCEHIPAVVPAVWTVFWIPPYDRGDFFWPPTFRNESNPFPRIKRVLVWNLSIAQVRTSVDETEERQTMKPTLETLARNLLKAVDRQYSAACSCTRCQKVSKEAEAIRKYFKQKDAK